MTLLTKYFYPNNKNPSLTKDPITELFIRIAIPSSVGTIFQTLYNVVDTYFAGKISPEALAAIAQTFPVFFYNNCHGSWIKYWYYCINSKCYWRKGR